MKTWRSEEGWMRDYPSLEANNRPNKKAAVASSPEIRAVYPVMNCPSQYRSYCRIALTFSATPVPMAL
jgi:hypothetical protein